MTSGRIPVSARCAAVAATLALALSLSLPAPAVAGGDWNDAKIGWKTYDEGLKQAKESNKPICLVLFTEWCPHCTNYAKIFHDSKVVERSADFVMVRIDNDKNAELSGQFAPDGKYIPRTFFLSPDGKLDPDIQARSDKYKYFYSENDPSSILAGMDAAQKKFN